MTELPSSVRIASLAVGIGIIIIALISSLLNIEINWTILTFIAMGVVGLLLFKTAIKEFFSKNKKTESKEVKEW